MTARGERREGDYGRSQTMGCEPLIFWSIDMMIPTPQRVGFATVLHEMEKRRTSTSPRKKTHTMPTPLSLSPHHADASTCRYTDSDTKGTSAYLPLCGLKGKKER